MKNISLNGLSVILASVAIILSGLALVVSFMQTRSPSVVTSTGNQAYREETHGSELNESLGQENSGLVASDQDEDDLVGVITVKDEETNTYTNDILGLSFDYPSTYNIEEQSAFNGVIGTDFFQGDRMAVYVKDEEGNIVFQAGTNSDDFGVDGQEGCCYYLHGKFDMTMSVLELGQELDDQLDQVFAPKKIQIDGRSALSFAYTTTYVAHAEFLGAITPRNDAQYSTVFFSSGYLGEVPIDQEVHYPYSNANAGIIADYQKILDTVTWIAQN